MSKNLKDYPLAGVKVIELGQIAAGPFVGMLLADLGADVVKIERPDGGDGMRTWPPILKNEFGEEYSGNFASLNRNKRSVVIDMKDEKQLNQLKKLCSVSDILIENYRPGVLKKFGMDYDSIAKINPRIVYCSISGYGHTGPYKNRGAFDVTIQAMSGFMSVTGEEDGPPVKAGVPVGDFVTALYGAYTIMAVYHKTQKTGKGAHIDCSMLGSLLGISALQTSEYYGTKIPPKRLGSRHPRNAPYQSYEAKDKPFVIAAGNDKLWQDVCKIVGKTELINDDRFKNQLLRAKNQKELNKILEPIFLTKTADEWLEKFNEKGIPCAPINNFEEILEDEHVKQMNLINTIKLPNQVVSKEIGFPIKISDYEFSIYRIPPKLGEHSEEVLNEWIENKSYDENVSNY